MSEAALFKSQLGNSWQNVHPEIQARFDEDPKLGYPIHYTGTMTVIYCSFVGSLLARITGFVTTGALCPWRGADIPAHIEVYREPGSPDIFKRRRYEFSEGRTYIFLSRMRSSPEGDLLEYVGRFLGMRVLVRERGGDLFFTDAGYFVEVFGKRIILPRLLSPGAVALTHANQAHDQFQILIAISHPLFGLMYRQEGIFTHCPA